MTKKKTLVGAVRDEMRSAWLNGPLYGAEFTMKDVLDIAAKHAPDFPDDHGSHESQRAVMSRMLQDERRKAKLVFVKRGLYRYDTGEKVWRTTPSKYDVPPIKAKRLRALFDKPGHKIDSRIPVRFAKLGRKFDVKPDVDFKDAVIADGGLDDPYSPDGCFEKKVCFRNGLPAVVLYKETAILEETARGKLVITLYASDRKPQMFDQGQQPPGTVQFRAIPKSWLPDARREMAQKRAKRIAKGVYTPRDYVRTGAFADKVKKLRISTF